MLQIIHFYSPKFFSKNGPFWECKLVQPLWRTMWRFLRKLEIELPYDHFHFRWKNIPKSLAILPRGAPEALLSKWKLERR